MTSHASWYFPRPHGVAGPAVVLSDPTAVQPTFDAPTVALGGATVTFQLTVTANGETATDTVSVTVVNVNQCQWPMPGTTSRWPRALLE